MSTWIALLVVGAGSYAFRLVPLMAGSRAAVVDRAQRALSYAGTAALSALVVTSISHQDDHGSAPGPLVAALAVLTGAAVVGRGGSMGKAIAAGMAVFWAAIAVIGLAS